MEALQRKVTEHFEIDGEAELAIEVDPRVTSRAQIDLLKRMGFNRLSMGVQDFTPEVQEIVNRRQTEAETRELYDYCRAQGFSAINLDMIYGLPLQTPETFARSTETVIDLRPERVALYSYAFIPWLKAHQKRVEQETLPPPEVKIRLFCIARSMFLDAGYEQIGMDHFALPEDELVQAMSNKRLHRNFMGYTVKMGSDMVGVGVSAIGDVRGSFAQNVKKLSTYGQAIGAGRFPIERGYLLSDDDSLRREVITRLMCNFYLDVREIEKRFGIDFASYFAVELGELRAADGPVDHGFLAIQPQHLEVLPPGRLFVRNVCMVFDHYLRTKTSDKPVFSRTV
jgi:oxygen-independent coproporphyrinogen-3 oxidase